MSNILHLVSIARKAGKLEVGEEPTAAAARARHAKLILVAKDATDNTYRRVRHFGDAGNVTWVSTPYTKVQLGAAIGRSAVAMVAVMDMGLAAAMVRGLAQDDPEKFGVTMERMDAKAEKALRRQQEKRQHEKNLKNGKYQSKQRQKQAEEAAEARRIEAQKPEKPEKTEKPTPERSRPHGGSWKSRSQGGKPGAPRREGSAPRNHSGGKRRTKGKGRSNRYEEFGSSGRPPRRYQKHRDP